MRQVLRERFDTAQVPDEAILMEEESFDTAGNLKLVNELCEAENIGSIALLTVGYHLPRTRRLAGRLLDVPIIGAYRSDDIVRKDRGKSGHSYTRSLFDQALERHSGRPLVRAASALALEAAAWGLILSGPVGERIARKATPKLRHQ